MAGKRTWNTISVEEFCRLFPVTDSTELAATMGVPKSTVTSYAQSIGLKKDPAWVHARRAQQYQQHSAIILPAIRRASRKLLDHLDAVVAEYQAGASLEALGKQYGVDAKTIQRVLIDQGVARRTPWEAPRPLRAPVPPGTYMRYGSLTKEEFIALYPTTHREDLAKLSGLTVVQVKTRARLLGLYRGPTRTVKTRERLRASHLGARMPKEQREKISRSHRANPRIRRGPAHPWWAGGCDPEGRNSAAYKAWRRAVLTRDEYICQDCNTFFGGRRCGRLHAHHIKPWATFKELRFSIENGVALCHRCHKKRHGLTPRKAS